jgi:hypothetical protein
MAKTVFRQQRIATEKPTCGYHAQFSRCTANALFLGSFIPIG